MLRVVRAVLSLSLIQPRLRLPVTPLRPAEHYHTYGELELNRKTRGLHVKCWYNTTAHTQSESPASLAVPEGRRWALEDYTATGHAQRASQANASEAARFARRDESVTLHAS